jgi:hypothetical protein
MFAAFASLQQAARLEVGLAIKYWLRRLKLTGKWDIGWLKNEKRAV